MLTTGFCTLINVYLVSNLFFIQVLLNLTEKVRQLLSLLDIGSCALITVYLGSNRSSHTGFIKYNWKGTPIIVSTSLVGCRVIYFNKWVFGQQFPFYTNFFKDDKLNIVNVVRDKGKCNTWIGMKKDAFQKQSKALRYKNMFFGLRRTKNEWYLIYMSSCISFEEES